MKRPNPGIRTRTIQYIYWLTILLPSVNKKYRNPSMSLIPMFFSFSAIPTRFDIKDQLAWVNARSGHIRWVRRRMSHAHSLKTAQNTNTSDHSFIHAIDPFHLLLNKPSLTKLFDFIKLCIHKLHSWYRETSLFTCVTILCQCISWHNQSSTQWMQISSKYTVF